MIPNRNKINIRKLVRFVSVSAQLRIIAGIMNPVIDQLSATTKLSMKTKVRFYPEEIYDRFLVMALPTTPFSSQKRCKVTLNVERQRKKLFRMNWPKS